ncbi:hypothetical protein NXC24_CH02572 [Rhizobium sp. NXC24]|nr:hypothetical protein NXC24_CH02572 [Rhizobium sp. NXC24]
MDQISLRRAAGIILTSRPRRRNNRLQSGKNTKEEKSSADAGEKTLNDLAHIAFSVAGSLPTEPGSDISVGSTCSSQVSQCRSITSAIDNARPQPGQPQKKSK